MRSWMLISMLLLSLLIHEAQGIRLIRKGTPSDIVQHIINPIKTLKEKSINGVEEIIQCKASECSGSVRKLMVSPISTNAKNINKMNRERVATKEENTNGKPSSSSTTEQRKPGPGESYPGVLDLAGMDYSQARRKPPIHN